MFSIYKVITRTSGKPSLFSRIQCKLCSTNQPTEERAVPPERCSVAQAQRPIELYGQPTAETHPHIINPNELVPGMTLGEFQGRRHDFMKKVMKTAPGKSHVAVIPSATKLYMTEKIPYVFRQNSDFLYLTGCQEPDSVLVMIGNDPDSFKSTIFIRKRDAHSELWDGPRTGTERAPSFFGLEQALPISDLKRFLKSFMKKNQDFRLWYDYTSVVHPEVNEVMKRFYAKVDEKSIWDSPRPHIHKLRLYKSPAEQALMRRSCEIASEAIARSMAVTAPGMTEHQLFATLDYESRMRGAEFLAYPPVVAAGSNATIIHYINNTQRMNGGDMVLVDAGCEYHGYTSDITRTWPVDGKFTDPQRVLYEVILTLQLELIDLTRDLPSLDNLFQYMCRSLGLKLKEAGVFADNISKDTLAKKAYEFCPHHVSHYLGMDVHDTATVTRSIPLEPGMIVTIEPGVYVSLDNDAARPEFRGLGVRIEDDVLITESGPVVLSTACPKEVEEVESLASSAKYKY